MIFLALVQYLAEFCLVNVICGLMLLWVTGVVKGDIACMSTVPSP